MATATCKRFSIVKQGTIFRTAGGLQGYYPRVLSLGGREFLASFVASTECESADSHPELARSTDGGMTWTAEGPLDDAGFAEGMTTETGFISKASDGSLFCLGAQWSYAPALPLVHPKTLGMRENRIVLRRSGSQGRAWTAPVELHKPYPVPLELPTGITALNDGTLIISCATWGNWDGTCPYGHRVTTMRSTDGGTTWTGPIDIFYDPKKRLGFWEARILQLSGDTLLATCWSHDWKTDKDAANHYAVSHDAGLTWTAGMPTPVKGQTGWPMLLDDGHILFVYNHRRAPVGVRAQIADVSGGQWKTVYDGEVWTPENRKVGEIVKGDYAVTHFQFGQPSAIRLRPDAFLVIYWCVVGGRAGIDFTMGRLD